MKKILAVIVNYGEEQIAYLETVIKHLKSFQKYQVTVIVNSNIKLDIEGIDVLNIIQLEDYQLLPLTCRKVIWDLRQQYDIFLFGENDHLFLEKHIDNHIEYSKLLPENRISGLIQYEEDETGKYYPGYHADFEWDFQSVEKVKGKLFAHFSNIHQATFILTSKQLKNIGERFNFEELVNKKSLLYKLKRRIGKKIGLKFERENKYSVKCKVNTDIYEFGGMKKVICISEFEDNLIHHLPNLYIEGKDGRQKLRSDSERMENSIKKMLGRVCD
jgi:hypothetical protein